MTKKSRVLAGIAGLAVVAAFAAGMLVARATPSGSTRNKLSFAGNIQPVPAAGATIGFTFTNTDDATTCSVSAGSPAIDANGNFVAELDLAACPAGFAFDGGDVSYTIAVNGTTVGGAQPVNPVPYAKYADRVAYDVNVVLSSTKFSYNWSASDTSGATVTGYAAARVTCQKTMGSKTAHWCGQEEMLRYVASGRTAAFPTGTYAWVATGGDRSVGGHSSVSDCAIPNASGGWGFAYFAWSPSDGGASSMQFGYPACSTPNVIACCD